ncbi:hypothetical protein CTEN210_09548 [Chaetoceros tenuissimus]|uniref:Thioredoxin domain-containing protein n=1 Tax=Chaetoceros tenuissimus TaxID=426638 RepID=A0AAD3H745_9STRA|nr:hypothetical protein CTEN210_09548 [Chaetoceros tenuissimus]
MKVIIQLANVLAIATLAFSQTYETTISRRERNLDHWDADTLAAYLGLDPDTAKPLDGDNYVGIDAGIMFYAQWCSNCHKFAGTWDAIAQIVHAGTTEGNLIMALFNCELNQQHTKLCDAAGVTHYPTIMYVGAGTYHDIDPISKKIVGDKAAGPYGASKLPRTVKFQGNLNVGDSVLDWIKAMQGLSTWHKWNHMEGGWLKGVRTLFKNPFGKKKRDISSNNALPVGIPSSGMKSTGSSSSGATSTYALEKTLKEKEQTLDVVKKQLEDSKLASNHAGYLIESFLFPAKSNTTDGEYIDIFSELTKTESWDAPADGKSGVSDEIILKSCFIDLTLDYCTRFSTKATNDYLDSLEGLGNDEYPSFAQMEKELRSQVEEAEPYCTLFSTCYDKQFSVDTEGCRPATCPLKNEAACRYLSACMSDSIRDEYKEALKKAEVVEESSNAATEKTKK